VQALYEDNGVAHPASIALGRVAWSRGRSRLTYLTRADLEAADVPPGDADDLIDVVRTAREADVAAVIKQQRDGRFKVSLRSRGGHDVAAAASRFGGGGHRLASGYTSSQGLVATVEALKGALGADPSAP
jgi:phosphoesterase RecJ-like protein